MLHQIKNAHALTRALHMPSPHTVLTIIMYQSNKFTVQPKKEKNSRSIDKHVDGFDDVSDGGEKANSF